MNDDRFGPDQQAETDYPEPVDVSFHTPPPQHLAGSVPTEESDIPPQADSVAPQPETEAAETEPSRKSGKWMKIIMLSVSALILVLAVLVIVLRPATPGPAPAPEVTPPAAQNDKPSFDNDRVSGVNSLPRHTAPAGLALQLLEKPSEEGLPLTEIYARCAPSVVGISTEMPKGGGSWGTGIIFTEDGYIITNAHVLDGAGTATVILHDDQEFEAALVGSDSYSDLAVLKIQAQGLVPAQFGDSDALLVGEDVVAIGNPLGENLRGTMTNGILSAINRDIPYQGHSLTLMQTNAAINEGNSGGPLINLHGQVIGVTNMKMMSSYTSIEAIGFAIPSRVVKDIVDQLLADGAVLGRPGIGVTVGPLDAAQRMQYGLPEGLYVSAVNESSDAYAQGVRVGDVITQVNGQPVRTTDEVNAQKEGLQVGDSFTVTIYREGEYLEITFALMDMAQLF